jgi:hypothetical protein
MKMEAILNETEQDYSQPTLFAYLSSDCFSPKLHEKMNSTFYSYE